jgi:ribosomal protein S18 acetylase RimI-like enzyme
MNIRYATSDDLSSIVRIENECFPPAQAASEESFAERLKIYPDHFWLLEIDGKVIGMIDGMVTNQLTISDEMFENAALHDESGVWQSIFGVTVLPEYQKMGFASLIMERVIADSRAQHRKGCILTCQEKLIAFYERFGYKNFGISESVHGGEVWYDMRLEF